MHAFILGYNFRFYFSLNRFSIKKVSANFYFICSPVESGHRIQEAMCHEVSVVGAGGAL